MPNFVEVHYKKPKKGTIEVYPKFYVRPSDQSDLMVKGGKFLAVYNKYTGYWTTSKDEALNLIDADTRLYLEENPEGIDFDSGTVQVDWMSDVENGAIDRWNKYVEKQAWDNFHELDSKLIFSNDAVKKTDYATKKLPYPLKMGSTEAWDAIVSTLYFPPEQHKIEWCIGSIVAGESVYNQKFAVLYGPPGSGKSTILNIIQDLFEGYWRVFSAKDLANNNSFGLEQFKDNPLVAIQHDGDLSRIEDNTVLNSIVSHETMTVNEKFKSLYATKFKSFLFIGTNKPVKITDAKSGVLRRLIDISPKGTGEKIPIRKYRQLMEQVKFELGAIAHKCMDVYLSNPEYYDDYIPITMLGASNDVYNFILENYIFFKKEKIVTLKSAYESYKNYCAESGIPKTLQKHVFKEELKNYFKEFYERYTVDDVELYNCYMNFIEKSFVRRKQDEVVPDEKAKNPFECNIDTSLFDSLYSECPAQYANEDGTPEKAWDKVTTKLKDLDTSRVHYIRPGESLIVIDFDKKNESGEKDYALNLKAAANWPPTYAELSKGGQGLHLHYIYQGDPSELSRIYEEDVEIKVFSGKASLRRRFSKCNGLPINPFTGVLPLKEKKKVVSDNTIKSEKKLRERIIKALNKEYSPNTKPSVDLIKKILDEVYESGLKYDISDLRPNVLAFAASSTHQSQACVKIVSQMKFKSEDYSINGENYDDDKIIFYDIEVFPNLFLVNWKIQGDANPVVRWINPSPAMIEDLIKHKLVGFNCRRYDNHLMYARLMGYTNEQLYSLSKSIIEQQKGFFGEAYNLSYTDVYDFSSKKQSLKKFEIELGIHHQELGLPWDQPVPEELWEKVAEYCDNDVIATEATFEYLKGDFVARQILADLAGMTVNDTTNSLTTRIIFGSDRRPQTQFNYRNLAETFPGYTFENGKSHYRGEDIGEGGYVYSEPGMYRNVVTFDVASMHPSSIIAENLFGDVYTQNFKDILQARIYIKHKEFDKAREMLGGKLAKHLEDTANAKSLAQALKIAINSVYGLTSAKFDNPFRDPRNVDNIVAKRGELFMIDLKHEVQERGFTVCHIKTDSIKIVNPNDEIISFVMEYGKKFGYNFEVEHKFDRICLVNDAVYIAKLADDDPEEPGQWTATGTQFQIPFVFKTLFSKEPIIFSDLCETKEVKQGELYLDLNEDLPEDEHFYQFIGRIGSFCPVLPGYHGGVLYRMKDDKYYAATGTKGYRWLEAETIKNLNYNDLIDRSYYIAKCDEAIETINKYCDFEEFAN